MFIPLVCISTRLPIRLVYPATGSPNCLIRGRLTNPTYPLTSNPIPSSSQNTTSPHIFLLLVVYVHWGQLAYTPRCRGLIHSNFPVDFFKVPHGAPAPSPHAKRSALSVDGIINNSAAAAASASTAYAAGLQAAAAAAIGLGQLADLSAVYRQATSASDQLASPRPIDSVCVCSTPYVHATGSVRLSMSVLSRAQVLLSKGEKREIAGHPLHA
ncbi:unnamed protein product [Hymenolepis diminuta]|uniref:Uncharacterized protein n=1 Tax=Hymenolepis diminuta TaxID=6216 RepID=A0A0R3SC39_HYMDI|nr:unnamed protein product [Hymenolepis diminuta]